MRKVGNMDTSTEEKNSVIPFEKALEQLQTIVRRLESGELSLEDSLKCFEDGVRLTRICQEQLSVAEQKVEILMKTTKDEKVELKDFSPK